MPSPADKPEAPEGNRGVAMALVSQQHLLPTHPVLYLDNASSFIDGQMKGGGQPGKIKDILYMLREDAQAMADLFNSIKLSYDG